MSQASDPCHVGDHFDPLDAATDCVDCIPADRLDADCSAAPSDFAGDEPENAHNRIRSPNAPTSYDFPTSASDCSGCEPCEGCEGSWSADDCSSGESSTCPSDSGSSSSSCSCSGHLTTYYPDGSEIPDDEKMDPGALILLDDDGGSDTVPMDITIDSSDDSSDGGDDDGGDDDGDDDDGDSGDDSSSSQKKYYLDYDDSQLAIYMDEDCTQYIAPQSTDEITESTTVYVQGVSLSDDEGDATVTLYCQDDSDDDGGDGDGDGDDDAVTAADDDDDDDDDTELDEVAFTVAQARIYRTDTGDSDITNIQDNAAMVGQGISLSVYIVTGSGPIHDFDQYFWYQWWPAGQVIANFDPTGVASQLTLLEEDDYTHQDFQYIWVQGGTGVGVSVRVSSNSAGQTDLSTAFNVTAPSMQTNATAYDGLDPGAPAGEPMGINIYPSLGAIQFGSLAERMAGMTFMAVGAAGSGGFQFDWCQVINNSGFDYLPTTPGVPPVQQAAVNALDGGFPYPMPMRQPPYYLTNDQPGETGLNGLLQNAGDGYGMRWGDYTMWLMAKPANVSGVYVPVAKFAWSYQFVLFWSYGEQAVLGGQHSPSGAFTPTTDFPSWTSILPP